MEQRIKKKGDSQEFKLKTKNDKLKMEKTPPQAVKQLFVGHRFSFSFFVFSRTACREDASSTSFSKCGGGGVCRPGNGATS
jgi:hypothetical protein